MPEAEPMVAISVDKLLHVPPPLGSVNKAVDPWHILLGPTITGGIGFTVTTILTPQIFSGPKEYVIVTVDGPGPGAAPPVTKPVVEPILAIDGLLLIQCPPGVASDKVVVPPPAQTTAVPVMPTGLG